MSRPIRLTSPSLFALFDADRPGEPAVCRVTALEGSVLAMRGDTLVLSSPYRLTSPRAAARCPTIAVALVHVPPGSPIRAVTHR